MLTITSTGPIGPIPVLSRSYGNTHFSRQSVRFTESLDATDETTLRTWAAENGHTVEGAPPVLWTIPGGNGLPLTTTATATLPVSVIPLVYRGLLRTETAWHLADIGADGSPNAGAHPVFRVIYSWTMDPNLGPVARGAKARFYDTQGNVILERDWPVKRYGVLMGQQDGAFSARKAGKVRRSNVVEDIEDISFAGIGAYLAAGNAADPAALAAAFKAAVGANDELYRQSPAAGALLSSTITAIVAAGDLAWLDVQIPWTRWDDSVTNGEQAGANVVVDTARNHMLDELVQPT